MEGFHRFYDSPTAFGNLPLDEQIAYFEKTMSLRTIIEQDDFKKAIPLEFLTMFLSAIINGDQAFEKEVARFLDKHLAKDGT